MISEQTTIVRHKIPELQSADIEIQMTVQIETPADPYANVSIEPRFKRTFPEELEDKFYQRLRNGVHGGASLSGNTLLPDSIVVRIMKLEITPSLGSNMDAKDEINIGYLLEATISGIVETLLRSMENLRTGKETYFELIEQSSNEESEDDISPQK